MAKSVTYVRKIMNYEFVFPGEYITWADIAIADVSARTNMVSGVDVVLPHTVVGNTIVVDDGTPTPGTMTFCVHIPEEMTEDQFGVYTCTSTTTPMMFVVTAPTAHIKIASPCGMRPSSLEGKTLRINNGVEFIVEMIALACVGNDAIVSVVFTTPTGGKTHAFGTSSDGSSTSFKDMPYVAGGGDKICKSTTPRYEHLGRWTAAVIIERPYNAYTLDFPVFNFTVSSADEELTISSDPIIGRMPFLAHISGKPCQYYAIDIQPVETVRNTNALSYVPVIHQNQFRYCGKTTNTSHNGLSVFQTIHTGTIGVEFDVAVDKLLCSYDITVYEASYDGTSYTIPNDSIRATVRVVPTRGTATIAASEHDIVKGDSVVLSGTNTDSSVIYLFLDGTNLGEGKSLPDLNAGTVVDPKNNVQPVAINPDGTWQYVWNSGPSELDTGEISIYCTSVLTNGNSSKSASSSKGEYAAPLIESAYDRISMYITNNDPVIPNANLMRAMRSR